MPHSGPSCRRTQILDAACDLFRRQGPGKTTIAQIARDAGVGVGTVYLEFRSKDTIIGALARRRQGLVIDAMRRAASSDARGPSRHADRLRAVFDARTERLLALADDGSHGAALLHGRACAGVSDACVEFHRAQHELLVLLVTRACADGEFAASDVEATATALSLAYASFEPPALFTRDRARLAHELSALHALVLDGLRTRG